MLYFTSKREQNQLGILTKYCIFIHIYMAIFVHLYEELSKKQKHRYDPALDV